MIGRVSLCGLWLLTGCRTAEPDEPLPFASAPSPPAPRSGAPTSKSPGQVPPLNPPPLSLVEQAARAPVDRPRGPTAVTVLVDCNPVLDAFGLACPESELVDGKRLTRPCFVKRGTGLEDVLTSLQEALTEVSVTAEVEVCGYGVANREPQLRCDRGFKRVCSAFRRGRKEVGLGWAVNALQARQASGAVSVVLTHGAASIGGAQSDDALRGFDATRLGREVGAGTLSFSGIYLGDVHVRRRTYAPGQTRIPGKPSERSGALALFVWGPKAGLTDRLAQSIAARLEDFSSVKLDAVSTGWEALAPKPSGPRAGYSGPKGGGLVACAANPGGWRCPVAPLPTGPGRNPQREVFFLDLPLVGQETELATVEGVQVVVRVGGEPVSQVLEVPVGTAPETLRLERLRPVDDCDRAMAALTRLAPLAQRPSPGGVGIVVPVACLPKGPGRDADIEVRVTQIGRPAPDEVVHAAWNRALDRAGIPDTAVTAAASVQGFRQILNAVSEAAWRRSWEGQRRELVHNLKVVRQ